jgi:4-diphosphocytidyl-2C-methyl-D-erythritol kinase
MALELGSDVPFLWMVRPLVQGRGERLFCRSEAVVVLIVNRSSGFDRVAYRQLAVERKESKTGLTNSPEG